MTNTNTAKVSKVGRRFHVTFLRNGAAIGSMVFGTKKNMLRNFKAHGITMWLV